MRSYLRVSAVAVAALLAACGGSSKSSTESGADTSGANSGAPPSSSQTVQDPGSSSNGETAQPKEADPQFASILGIVIDEDGNPIKQESVYLSGTDYANCIALKTCAGTALDGTFSIQVPVNEDGSIRPYDLIITRHGGTLITVYQGLTVPHPQIFLWMREAGTQTDYLTYDAAIQGVLNGGDQSVVDVVDQILTSAWFQERCELFKRDTGSDNCDALKFHYTLPTKVAFDSYQTSSWYDPDAQDDDVSLAKLGFFTGHDGLPPSLCTAAGKYNIDLEWQGPASVSINDGNNLVGNMLAIQYVPDVTTGLPSRYYYAWASGVGPVTSGVYNFPGPTLFLGETATDSVQGVVTAPNHYNIVDKFVGGQFPNGVNTLLFKDRSAGKQDAAWHYIVPDAWIGDKVMRTQVCAKTVDDTVNMERDVSVTCNGHISNDDGWSNIVIRGAATPQSPIDAVDSPFPFADALFSWTPPFLRDGTLDLNHIVVIKIRPEVPTTADGDQLSKTFIIVKSGADCSASQNLCQTTVPALGAIGGLPNSGAHDYAWTVRTFGPFGNIDEFVTTYNTDSRVPVAIPPFNMVPPDLRDGPGNLTAPVPEAWFTKSQEYDFK
jgi:hypothetical protein